MSITDAVRLWETLNVPYYPEQPPALEAAPTNTLTEWTLRNLAANGAPILLFVSYIGSLGIPFPITIVIVAAGAFTRTGLLDWRLALLACLAGAALADNSEYILGRFAQQWLRRRFGQKFAWQRAQSTINRQGWWAILVTRFWLTPLAPAINVIAGSRYPFFRFLFFDLLGQFVWVLLFGGLGYLFASQWELVGQVISTFSGLSVGLLFLALGAYFLIQRRKTRKGNEKRTTMIKFMAVIPAYNEAEHISQVVRQARHYLPVLVVDDGSVDETARLAEAEGAEVLRQVPNRGKGAALRAGFLRALELGCEAVITLDGDGQHDPAEIHKFLQAYAAAPADLIIGQRNFNKMPLARRLANTTGCWLFSWAMGQSIPDNQSGYRMLSRHFLEYLLESTEQGFEFEVEMLATCLKNHFYLRWVPIRTIYAGEASHIHPWKHIVNFMRIIWITRQRMRARAVS
jgi:membrane protein DedA with SNARE-associated domain